MKYIFFLGSHPPISATECFVVLKTLGYSPRVVKTHPKWLMLKTSKTLPDGVIDLLGGTDRIAESTAVFNNIPTAQDIFDAIKPVPKKITVGLGAINIKQINTRRLAIDLKKAARQSGSRLRFITPNKKTQQLNAAQVIFNSLHREPNKELTIVKKDSQYELLTTRQIQDIQSYEARDTSRPARSSVVGMLPPKLAQIMVNLATQKEKAEILDPFCGMGTVLQEGWLKGHKMTGSDSNQNILKASEQNMQYLKLSWPNISNPLPELVHHDAGQPFSSKWQNRFDAIVTEPYLGPALSAPLPRPELLKLAAKLNNLYLSAFRNFLPILKDDGIILFLLPAWRSKHHSDVPLQLFPKSLLDEIVSYGYSIKQLVPDELRDDYSPTDRGTLVYARPDALVGREITLWQKS